MLCYNKNNIQREEHATKDLRSFSYFPSLFSFLPINNWIYVSISWIMRLRSKKWNVNSTQMRSKHVKWIEIKVNWIVSEMKWNESLIKWNKRNKSWRRKLDTERSKILSIFVFHLLLPFYSSTSYSSSYFSFTSSWMREIDVEGGMECKYRFK